ncbi:MAG: transketolase [Gammaproteobacteria bacterium]|nr:transketolase [Gammaproteobacteria bacterium]
MTDVVSRRDCANAIRALSMDAVQKANSGHPGAPMGMADIAEVLWRDHLSHNPANPRWFNRDRFVLSNGHGSMLIYSLLHLTGYDLPLSELQNFRQLHSATPGHPEYGDTPGVETTTGPLGQGLANGVGMAIAEKTLGAQFNREGHTIVDHYTYVFAGDGCLMEGISHEVCSLAGTLKLGKLIVIYDDNGISIDGQVEQWFSDDTIMRFEAYGWQVLQADGHDPEAIGSAIETAQAESERPTLISCRTVIGFGSPNKAGTAATHGAPLGEEEVAAVRTELSWSHAPFVIPEAIRQAWNCTEKGSMAEAVWKKKLLQYEAAYPKLAVEFTRRINSQLPDCFSGEADAFIKQCQHSDGNLASRKASQQCIEAYAAVLPELIGGSADLTGSNLTTWSGSKPVSQATDGNYIYFGVREFGMSAIATGLALHGGFIPYTATFLIFMEYARNAVRMAALMGQRSIFVYTHDSIGQGEDGPTHQPVEQLTTLRITPNMSLWRPADNVETAVAWKSAIERSEGPTSLVFSRQSLPHLQRTDEQMSNIARGGYIMRDCEGEPQLVIIATGSELSICLEAGTTLNGEGLQTRVVSIPSVDVFEAQDQVYRDSVLPPGVRRRLAVECGASDFWYKLVGLDGKVLGLRRFGASAPGEVLMQHFGFTAENVIALARSFDYHSC